MSLSNKVKKWMDEKIITTKQSQAILAYEQGRKTNIFWRALFSIAGLMIGLGFILITAANWDILPDGSKLLGDFMLLAVLSYMTYWCWERQKKLLQEFFGLLSFLMVGATIGLVGQIFHLEGGWSSFAMAWAVLTIPFIMASRSIIFNLGWLLVLFSSFNFRLLDLLFDYLERHFEGMIAIVLVLSLLSYAGKKLDEAVHRYTLLPRAFSKLALWATYVAVWFFGCRWGMISWRNTALVMILANAFVFAFFAARLFKAFWEQNISSFVRNVLITEIYIFVLFATRFGDLLYSGFGFIAAGLLVLGLIYVLKKTSRYIKSMEVFK